MEGEGEPRGTGRGGGQAEGLAPATAGDKWWKRILFADEAYGERNVAERKNGRRPHLNLCGYLQGGGRRKCEKEGERSRGTRGTEWNRREKKKPLGATKRAARTGAR